MHLYLIMFHPASVLHQFHHVSSISCWHILTDSKTAWVFQPIVFFFRFTRPDARVHCRACRASKAWSPGWTWLNCAAMQVRFPETWFKTSPCYVVVDQWYMFLIYVPFVMVIRIYGYDNHDICHDIICFLEIRSRRQGRRWWIELSRIVAWCWRTSWERHRKGHGTSGFFVISSPNPKLFQKKILDVTKQIEKHIMLTSIKTSGK